MTVLVVGGGLAGIAATIKLRERGVDARLVEPGPLGGRARTETIAPGWRVELGPHSFTGRAEAFRSLTHALGLDDQIEATRPVARARFVLRGGKLRKAGPGLLASWPVLSGLFRRVQDPQDVSVRDWFAARMGDEFADGLLAAMCAGIWATSPDRVDMAVGFPLIHAAVAKHGTIASAAWNRERGGVTGMFSLRGGLGAIGDAARIQLGQNGVIEATADALVAEDGGWTIATAKGPVHADAVVLAAEAPATAALLDALAPNAAATLRSVEYSPLTVAHWMARDARYPLGFGFLTEPASRIRSLGTIFVGDILEDRVPSGARSFATMLPDATLTDEAVLAALQLEHRTLTGHDVTIDGLHIVRHPHAVAVPRPGQARRLEGLQADLPAGIVLAGSYLGAGAMDDAVRSGQAAAATLARG